MQFRSLASNLSSFARLVNVFVEPFPLFDVVFFLFFVNDTSARR